MRGSALRIIGIGLVAAMAIAGVARAADGDFETAFNGTGKLSGTFSGGPDAITDAAVQPDGKLVTVGWSSVGDMSVDRFNTDGTPDSSFDTDGHLTIDSGTTDGGEWGTDVAIDPGNGDIVVVGEAVITGASALVVARVSSTGVLDPAFDGPGGSGDGVFRLGLPGTNDYAGAVALSGEQIVIGDNSDTSGVIARLNHDGTLDTTGFGSPNGYLVFTMGAQTYVNGVAVADDGSIVVGGSVNTGSSGMGVAKITSAGALDTANFNSPNGYVLTPKPPGYANSSVAELLVQAGGAIVLAGSVEAFSPSYVSNSALERVTSAGALDTLFGSSGFALLPPGATYNGFNAVVAEADGKLIAAGITGEVGDNDATVARFSADGILDSSFSADDPAGQLAFDFGDSSSINGVAMSPEGRVAYLVGGSGNSYPLTNYGVAAIRALPEPPPPPPPPPPPVKCAGVTATKVGSNSGETIKGTAHRDVIAALGGNDTVKGLAGNDLICGGSGNDRLLGGAGRDILRGEAGKDKLIGGPGKDKLIGGPGKDSQHQ